MKRISIGIIIALAAVALIFFLYNGGPEPITPETVQVTASYQHPEISLSVYPPEATEYIEVSMPDVSFTKDKLKGQINITLEDEAWDFDRDYQLSFGLQETPYYILESTQFSFTTPPEPAFDLVAVGDVMLDQMTSARLRDYDVNYPFAKIKHITSSGDLNFANLESPLSDRGEPMDKRFVFRARPYTVEALNIAGFNVVALANNHILDYGPDAMMDTIDILDENNIAHAGAGGNEEEARRGAHMEINGVRVAILAYTGAFPYRTYPGWAATPDTPGTVFYMDRDKMLADVEKAREEADVVIVSMHWGNEYTYAVNSTQRQLGRLLVDSGADLILGHHSHTPQGIEFYKDKPIVYGLGNFIFYPFSIEICNETYILQARIGLEGVESMRLTPVLLGDSQPFVPEGSELERMHGIISMLLDEFGTGYSIQGEEVIIEMP